MPSEIIEHEQHVEIAGHSIFTKIWSPQTPPHSKRTPIVIFHDSLGCVELWRTFPEALAIKSGRAVIAYDRLGFGRSDPHPSRLGFEFIAAEATVIAELGDRLGFFDFIVCGHSVGGAMAVETAARYPDRCRAIVTISAQAFVEGRTLDGIRSAKRNLEDPANFAKLAKYHGGKTRWVIDAWIGTWLDPAFAGWCLDDAIGHISAPVLAIHGERDEYGSLEHPRRISAGHGHMRVLRETGHVPHREQEQELVDLVQSFFCDKTIDLRNAV